MTEQNKKTYTPEFKKEAGLARPKLNVVKLRRHLRNIGELFHKLPPPSGQTNLRKPKPPTGVASGGRFRIFLQRKD
jgi:hypothetical protein